MSDLVKRPELLKESSRDFDFFDFQKFAKNLSNNLRASKTPTVTVLVGGYGTGKSVLLNEVNKLTDASRAKQKPKWVFFECWQYPDKGDLWEALILQIVEAIDGKKKREKLMKSYSDIRTWRDEVSDYLGSVNTASATIIGLAIISWLTYSFANEELKNAFLAIVTATIVVLLATIKFLVKPESKSAISRLNDYRSELENTIKNYSGILYIVIEDMDRAGELGRQFFETVSYFIKEDMFANKNIKLVVPVANIEDENKKALRDSVDKATDNILYFEPSYNCEGFITEVFSESFLDESTKRLLIDTINPLLGRNVSVRKLKQIFRNAITKHQRLMKDGFESNLAICIAVELSKYMPGPVGENPLYKRRNHYEHKPLFQWASQNNMIDMKSDDEKKHIETRSHFEVSSDVFADFSHRDHPTNSYRGNNVQIHNRNYLISRVYFEDL